MKNPRPGPLLACLALACGPQPTEAATEAETPSTSEIPATSTSEPTTSDPGATDPTGGPTDACALAPVATECDNFLVGYYFDPKTETCQRFDHGTCGGEVVPFSTLEACQSACEPCEAFFAEPDPSGPTTLSVRNNSPAPIYLQTYRPDDSPIQYHAQIFTLGRFDFEEDLLTAPNGCDFSCADHNNEACAVGCGTGDPPPPPIVIHPGGVFSSAWNGLHFGTAPLPDRCVPAACSPGLQCGRWQQAPPGSYEVSATVATAWDCGLADCTCDANAEGWCELPAATGGPVDPQVLKGHFLLPGAGTALVFE
jgi:hypothetical protein